MKSKKTFKKKDNNYQNENDEIKIKERKKIPNKKFKKQDFYAMIEEEDDEIDLYGYLEE